MGEGGVGAANIDEPGEGVAGQSRVGVTRRCGRVWVWLCLTSVKLSGNRWPSAMC